MNVSNVEATLTKINTFVLRKNMTFTEIILFFLFSSFISYKFYRDLQMSSDHQSGEPSDMSKTVYVEQIKEDEYGNVVMDHGEIISEEVLHEDMLAEDVEIEYVEEQLMNGDEVILDGNGEEILEAEMATESLVALSQGSKDHPKELRNEYIHNISMQSRDPMRSPRILRRSGMQRGFAYEQGSSRQPTVAKPNFPVPAHTKRLLPVATLQQNKPQDWREAQKRRLEICEIYEVLPDNMRDTFKRIIETGDQASGRSRMTLKRYPNDSDYGDVPQETAARIYKEEEQLEQQHDEMHHNKKIMGHSDYNDMPQLEEANDGDNQTGNETQIDVEHYDSNDEAQMHESMQYIMDDSELVEMEYRDESSLKIDHRRGSMLMPTMREEYYAGDANNYSSNQIIVSNVNQFQGDSRFCPGCKLHLKRSIFYHHSRMIKKYGICNMFTPKRFPCGVPGCGEKLGTVEKLCEHMHQIHNAPTDIKTEVFSTSQEFQAFLRELEAKGGNFRMSRGNKMIKTGMVQYFRCNRTQAMAKEKTMRICDEVGLFGEPVGSGVIDRPDDPFANPTVGGKPQLRTEEACTAFFRKAFLPDGSIEVRYCDHHLHEDERLRLPSAVKERIYEMHRKQLAPPVILMVLQEEREQYALPGSAVERKLMTLTPKDISAVISTRNSNARKRNKAKQEGKNIAADCDQLVIDRNDPLTEMEQKCLEQYMSNEPSILRDMAEMKRIENKRRHLRESIRNNVFHLGRYIKTSTFADMSTEHLESICSLVKEAAAISRMKSVHDLKDMEEETKMIKREKSPMMMSRSRNDMSQDIVDNQEYGDETVITDGQIDVIDGSYISVNHMDMPSTSAVKDSPSMDMSGHLEEQEQIIVEQEEPEPPAAKKKRGRRPKEILTKEEKTETVYNPEPTQESPLNLPSRTSRGRVVRPSRHFMDI